MPHRIDQALADSGLREEEVEYVVGTGYGRYKVTFGNTQVTEISCHGRGAVHMFPGTRTVIDMGGQDTKAISVAGNGEIVDFCMNDKCAAGTGRFLEVITRTLGARVEQLDELLQGAEPHDISSMCTVFAESEAISLRSAGTPRLAVAVAQAETLPVMSPARALITCWPLACAVVSSVTLKGGAVSTPPMGTPSSARRAPRHQSLAWLTG